MAQYPGFLRLTNLEIHAERLFAEVEAHMATYCLFATNHQRQLAHGQYNFDHDGPTVVKRSRVRTVRAMPIRN